MRNNARHSNTGNALRLSGIVKRLGGTLQGNGNTLIKRVASLQSAGPGDISFLSSLRYRTELAGSRASAVILPQRTAIQMSVPSIHCKDPYLYFAEVANLLAPAAKASSGCHHSAIIEEDAQVSADAQVDAGVYIGHRARIAAGAIIGPGCKLGNDTKVGKGTRLHANVTIYENCAIGQRGIVHAGVVIGADGFGMALKEGRWLKIPQTGRVLIGDDVEIGANTAIDRGALDDTVIEDGVKLDNLIQVGHNVHIGAHTAIAGCVGIAGSARIGRHCTIGGGAIVLGHLELADHVNVSAATLITKSIGKPGTYTGVFPFDEHHEWGRSAAAIRNLDELVHRIRRLEKRVEADAHGVAAPKVIVLAPDKRVKARAPGSTKKGKRN